MKEILLGNLFIGDCIKSMRMMIPGIVQTCVTSPPYFGLRDYGVQGQIGLESTIDEYIKKMVEVFREVKRILRDDGTVWLNLGDSYAGSGKGQWHGVSSDPKNNKTKGMSLNVHKSLYIGLKNKDLIGIPWRIAFALQTDGWYLRQGIIWAKSNPMPEPVSDRCTKSHEYIFLLSKSPRYYFDAEAIKEKRVAYETRPAGIVRDRDYNYDSKQKKIPRPDKGNAKTFRGGGSYVNNASFKNSAVKERNSTGNQPVSSQFRNRRDVWTIATKPFKGAHFATFPQELVKPCVLAGSSINDYVFDPFMGAGTTAVVAESLGRNWMGCELNEEYALMAEKRILAARSK